MKQFIYVFKDRIGWFQQPMAFMSDDLARRFFAGAMKSEQYDGVKEDISLYRIASFNVETGKVDPEEFPVLIADGVEYAE